VDVIDMNRKKSIEYSEKEYNPYTGCLNWEELIKWHGCQICDLGKDCWAYGMAQRLRGRYGYDPDKPFKPTFHEDKLKQPLHRKKPTIYATCFMGEIGYCKDRWFSQILDVIWECPQHTFIMLTKMPWVFQSRQEDWPDNVWLGVTITKNGELFKLDILKQLDIKHPIVSFEPLREKMSPNLEGIEGIAIGAKTGAHPYQPKESHVKRLLICARHDNCKVVIKDNLDFVPKLVEWP